MAVNDNGAKAVLKKGIKRFQGFSFFQPYLYGIIPPLGSVSHHIHPINLFPGFCEAITPPLSRRKEERESCWD